MAKIEDQYELKVNSGGLDTLIKQAEKTVEKANQMNAALNRFPPVTGKVSSATQRLVEQLGVYQDAVREAFTTNQQEKAVRQLIQQMDRLGLVFTTTEEEANRAAILTSESLSELARSGALTANTMAEAAYRARGGFKKMEYTVYSASNAVGELQTWGNTAGYTLYKLGNLGGKVVYGGMRLAARSFSMVAQGAKSAGGAVIGFARNITGLRTPVDNITGRLVRMAATLFTASKLMQYIHNAIERAPEERAAPFVGLKTDLSDAGARAIVSLMKGMQGGVDRLLRSMNSPAGQKFFRGLERSADAAGRVVGKALDLIGGGIEWIGDHGETAFTIAGVALAFFAAQMLAAGAATAAASWPILLILGLTAALVAGLMKAGYTAEDIFWWIGAGAGFLYALVYNIVVDLYNLFATFAEFFANVFNDPVSAVAHLFIDTFDVILSMVETAAKAIDRLTGSNLAAGIANLRSGLQSWADQTFGKNEIKIARMDKISYTDMMSAWAEKVAGLGSQLSDFSLSNALAQTIKAIAGDTNAIRKSVSLTAEDLKSLVDVAVRRYVNHISLTSQTPVITVNGANTGRTAEDRQALADAIAEVLIEQTASGSTVDARTPT